MSIKYKFHDSAFPYFISFSTVEWVDAFTRTAYKDILINSLKFCQQNKDLHIHAWCLMTNHIHLIASSEKNELPHIMRDMKKFTSRQIIQEIIENPQESRKRWMLWIFRSNGERNPNNEEYQFWQQDNHPVELNTSELILEKLNYIHNNPVKAGIVAHPHEYLYSSAGDYAGTKGLLEIDFLL